MRTPGNANLPAERPLARWPGNLPTVLVLVAGMLAACGRAPEAPAPPTPEIRPSQARDTRPVRAEEPDAEQVAFPRFGKLAEQTASALPVYDLRISPRDFARMEQSAFSNDTVPGLFVTDGVTYDNVRVRYRGAWARSWPKKPIKIFFDKEKRYAGQRCLNLNSGWHDPALVRECLAYHIYAACGAPASQSRMVRLNVNGEFHGVYVQVEQPDQGFVQRLNLRGAASFKADSRANRADERDLGSEQAYRQHYEKQTVKSEGYEDLQRFCQELARTRNVAGFFEENVDVEKYINYLAAGVLVQNWDGYNKNHYLIYDRLGSKKWFAAPWDLDRTLGDHWEWGFDRTDLPIMLGTRRLPGVTGWNRMQDRFLSEPVFRERFLKRVGELLETEFAPEKLFPVLDKLEAEIGADAVLDRRRWRAHAPNLHRAIAQVKRYIERRRAFLQAELRRSR